MHYILIGATSICGITDVYKRKIPNVITLPLLLLSLIYGIFLNDYKMALLGLFVSFIIGFTGFVLGQLGAGDVKLMMALATTLGVKVFFELLFVSAIIGLIWASVETIIKAIKRKNIRRNVINLMNHIYFLNVASIKEFVTRENKIPIPIGMCLSVGLLIVLLK